MANSYKDRSISEKRMKKKSNLDLETQGPLDTSSDVHDYVPSGLGIHVKFLVAIYVVVVVIYFLSIYFFSPYLRDIPQELKPWTKHGHYDDIKRQNI